MDKPKDSNRNIDVFRIFIMSLDWLQSLVSTMIYVLGRKGYCAFESHCKLVIIKEAGGVLFQIASYYF